MKAADERLASLLMPICQGTNRPQFESLAALADTSPRTIRRAARGQEISACQHLRLCAGLGYDPYMPREFAPFDLGRFDRGLFARAVRQYRTDKRIGLNVAAVAIGISSRALSFIEHATGVSIDNTLAVCRFIGIHPFCFGRRSTCNTGCNSLAQKAEAA